MRPTAQAALALLIIAVGVCAVAPSPLRAIPAEADWVVAIENPQRLVQSITALDALREIQKIAAIKEVFENTNARRFYQLVAYFEKQLGHPYPELIDGLAGG